MGEAWIVVCSQLHALGPRGTSALESKAIREMFVEALRERSGEAKKRLPLGRGRRAER